MLYNPRLLLCVLIASAVAGQAAAQPSNSYVGSSQSFTLTEKTQIPGGTLKPGEYTIHVLDQLSDRMIVRVDSSAGSEHSIFLGVPHGEFSGAAAPGPVAWQNGLQGGSILRGFEFASGSDIEFVYPKAEAAALAKLNAAKVVAVDPESEGRPVFKKMSQDDMQVVTLWMLSLTTEAPNSKTPAILAQRYVPDSTGPRTQVASRPPVQPTSPTTTAQVASLEPAPVPLPSTPAVAPKRQHAISQLPHTGSSLPLIWMLGSACLLLSLTLRFARLGLGGGKTSL